MFSGHTEENAPHSEVVGQMVHEEAEKALNEWEAISSIRPFPKTKRNLRLNMIQSNAETNEKDEYDPA